VAIVARSIYALWVSLLAVAVLAPPAGALPRVECVPEAVCGTADERPAPPPAGRHACCAAEPTKSVSDAESGAAVATNPASGTGNDSPCCVLTSGVPADLWIASAATAVPAPPLDAVAELPAVADATPADAVGVGAVTTSPPRLPQWQMAPEQGAGPRPPPTA
jgi:hypothetical protein